MTQHEGFFSNTLEKADNELFSTIKNEIERQSDQIELIASENIVSNAVLEAQGSIMTNKYAEGYPGKRYYGGCEFHDIAENLAIERLKKLYKCNYANVQPHSGAQANQAVFLALLKPGDTILGMSLDAGGHLTHGSKPNQSGKYFNAVQYGIDPNTSLIDYDSLEKLAIECKPKMIIAGGSAYPRNIDFKKFREIADKVDAYLLVDMAHYSGLVAAEEYPDPLPYGHVVTSTTHKTIRGPRGGMILSNDMDLGKKFNSAVFPGLQGGPLMHVIAAKAVAFGEALKPEFKDYIKQVKANAKILSEVLMKNGIDIVTKGTDSHMVLVDLRSKNVTGKDAEESLERAGMTCNKNGVSNDPNPPTITSGIRLGSPAATTRGFKEKEFEFIGESISTVINTLSSSNSDIEMLENSIKKEVYDLCQRFPIYKN
ncbi:serine hydroxymethyltransferase [Alphaproteobacteria bacterium]|jgi:glycine hydroxymethyltransferase|nr:serine hydroxymethyltransferase [Alphaproteobacteria bacterium]MDB4234049.1 serine hydroxymethyltransferase [Alphaproteobacteria bacterium]MDB9825355.1 serine hydroxymethyltransferase [Alphaproteobacteria bacterium]